MTGRPTKLTPETHAAIIADVKAGVPLTYAAEHAGVHRSVVYDWLKRGEAENPPPDDAEYTVFAEEFRKAAADAVVAAVKTVRSGAEGWKGPAFWLERCHPQTFARTTKTELSGPDGGAIAVKTGVVILPAWGASDGRTFPDPEPAQ